MPKFLVDIEWTGRGESAFVVEADSPEEAEEIFWDGIEIHHSYDVVEEQVVSVEPYEGDCEV